MTAKLEFFPVGNGDMTLLTLETGRMLLLDCNIRKKAVDESDSTFNVLDALRQRLPTDDLGRPYLDVFILSHPDTDHCRGFSEYFYQGSPSDRADDDDRILVRELWSSPIVYRRFSSTDEVIGDDAAAFCAEAKRRVKVWKAHGTAGDGDLVQILGHDVDHKTDDVDDIVVVAGDKISFIAGERDDSFEALLLAPAEPSDDTDIEDARAKNNSSVIIRFKINSDEEEVKFLSGGDAHAWIWEQIGEKYEAEGLEWDILQVPHHCSWHSLSNESWSENDEPKLNKKAVSALSNMVDSTSAVIVASCKQIDDNDDDPPSYAAKSEYLSWLDDNEDRFLCTADFAVEEGGEVLALEVTSEGVSLLSRDLEVKAASMIGVTTIEHG
jgi:hypothetical protein